MRTKLFDIIEEIVEQLPAPEAVASGTARDDGLLLVPKAAVEALSKFLNEDHISLDLVMKAYLAAFMADGHSERRCRSTFNSRDREMFTAAVKAIIEDL